MAENQTTAAPETAAEPTTGRVTRIQGSVIDVEFPVGHLPDIYNALTVELTNTANEEGETTKKITLEVEQHLGRCVSRLPNTGHCGQPSLRRPPGPDAGDSGSPGGQANPVRSAGHCFPTAGVAPELLPAADGCRGFPAQIVKKVSPFFDKPKKQCCGAVPRHCFSSYHAFRPQRAI